MWGSGLGSGRIEAGKGGKESGISGGPFSFPVQVSDLVKKGIPDDLGTSTQNIWCKGKIMK